MPVESGATLRARTIDVEPDPDFVEALIQNNPPAPFGNSHHVNFQLLEVERIAQKRLWKRVDLARWRSAGLTSLLVRLERARPASPRPLGTTYLVPERHAKLLRLNDQVDEAGRARIEEAASLVIAVRPTIAA